MRVPIIPRVWITKCAITRGVYSIDNVERHGSTIVSTRRGYTELFFRKEWHRAETAALARAEKMRRDELASLEKQIAKLKKQIAKLEKLTFVAKDGPR